MTVDTRFKLRISSSLRLLTINHYIVLTYSRNESNDKYKYQSLIGITKNRLTGETLTKDKRVKAAYSAITKRIGVTDEECHREYSCFIQETSTPDSNTNTLEVETKSG